MLKLIPIVLIVLGAIPFHINPDNFIADDAYFYLQIAKQVVNGHGSTFHQITQTNGYHPLWLGVCVLGAWITGDNPAGFIHLMGIVQLGLYAFSVWLLYHISQQLRLHYFIIGVMFFSLIMLFVGGLRLFEAHLAITLQLWALTLFIDLMHGKPRFMLLSVVLGLIFLSRLDLVFFIASLGLAALWNYRYQWTVPRFLQFSIPITVIVSLYIGSNIYFFGHLVPISGAIKSHFPEITWTFENLKLHGKLVVFASLFALTIAWYLAERGSDVRNVLGVLFWGVILHALYTTAFSWGSQWYWVTAYISFPLAAMSVLTHAFKQWRRFVYAVCLMIMSVGVIGAYVKAQYNFSIVCVLLGKQTFATKIQDNQGKQAALALDRHLPPGTAVMVYDSPGVIAYYSSLKIFPVDGLVNDYTYNEELRDRGIQGYCQTHGIEYFLGPELSEGMTSRQDTLNGNSHQGKQIFQFYAPLDVSHCGQITFDQSQMIMRLPDPVRRMDGDPHYVGLWKLEPHFSQTL